MWHYNFTFPKSHGPFLQRKMCHVVSTGLARNSTRLNVNSAHISK